MAVLSEGPVSGGRTGLAVAMGALALLLLVIALNFALEGIRMLRVSRNEARWEWERSIRHPL